jgi:hypothetical protein
MARPRKYNTSEERKIAARQYHIAYYYRFELFTFLKFLSYDVLKGTEMKFALR